MSTVDNRYQVEHAITAGQFSPPTPFPRRVSNVTVRVEPGVGGTANVYFTLDAWADVAADPDNARWDEWEPGSVSAATARALAGPVIALRAEAVTADAVLQVVGSYDY